jgi:alpha-D-xyloside xylohydrolase
MLERGLLIRNERGFRAVMDFQGNTVHFDATNPEARKYVWEKARENYGQYGIRLFWLDEAEPEYRVYDFDNWRYHLGPSLAIGNIYPRDYSRAFYEGALAAAGSTASISAGDVKVGDGKPNLVNLVRCAWAGSQKYGALVWSGDVASSWESFRQQLSAGLNMGMAGIPYWTTDIGGFHGGDPSDPAFRELLVRWFQWGAFLPVFRLHGDRWPQKPPLGTSGGGKCPSGADNEVWSYGEEVEAILKKYLLLRENTLRSEIRMLVGRASKTGDPIIRPLFYDFPQDANTWDVEDEYMFGPRYLVAPILYPGVRQRKVYFPGFDDAMPSMFRWREIETGQEFEPRSTHMVDAPLERMPVFVCGPRR